jgi:hypothetical protein
MITSQMQLLPECDRILVLKSGKIIDEGTYVELKARHSHLASWVTDVGHVEDDPTGVFEKRINNLILVNEIHLDSVTIITERSSHINPLRARAANQGPLSHIALKKAPKNRSSPLASAKVINAKPLDIISPLGANMDTAGIEFLIKQNNKSIQNVELNEHSISKMIERNQGDILTGNKMRPPANFSNQDIVTRTIEANQLTIHSVHTFDANNVEPGVFPDSASKTPFQSFLQILKEGPGFYEGMVIIFSFFLGFAFRILSGIPIINKLIFGSCLLLMRVKAIIQRI